MHTDDGPKAKIGTREFRHDVDREREQRNEDQDNPLPNNTQCPKDVGLPSTRLLNHHETIWTHRMQHSINSLELCRKHITDAPNGRQGSNNARLQAIVFEP
jgi:hypothetical protein